MPACPDVLAELAVGDADTERDGLDPGKLRVVFAELGDLLKTVLGLDRVGRQVGQPRNGYAAAGAQ
jgi:hypothetical protein